ncbi:MAG: radical SAM protein [Candidatus Melainabacteria bacterium]|nr:radical SAM protein [Candidatus Melainabacteria bacterium]
MLGNEVPILPSPVKSKQLVGVTWAFPNTYEVGMSSLGYQLVWWLLNTDRQTKVCRVFTNYQQPDWQASELIGFTLSWELDYINVLKLLQKAGVNELACNRKTDEPLVFGGGPVLTANPEPFADFFDVIALGDAEEVIPKMLSQWMQIRHLKSRTEKLWQLAQIEGIYVPSLYTYKTSNPQGPLEAVVPVDSRLPKHLSKAVFLPPPEYVAHSLLLAPQSTFGDMFLIETSRSCPQQCQFCLASYLTRPFRAAPVETILAKVDLGLQYTNKIGLVGPSVTEHPDFKLLALRLIERPNIQISISSIRLDTLSPAVLEMLATLGQQSVTMAIESGSERLRSIIKKNLDEATIHRALELIAASNLKAVKLYAMVGLPGETTEDLEETVRLIRQIKTKYKHLRFVLGVSSFVPKAQTPFQWAGRDRQARQKLEFLTKQISKLGIEVRTESHNWSDMQALLSRGDRRLSPSLLNASHGPSSVGTWRHLLRHTPAMCPSADYYLYRNIPYDETLPWSHLTDEVKSNMLAKQAKTAEGLIALPVETSIPNKNC